MASMRRIDFHSQEEYDEYLRNEMAYADQKCYSPDPLTQFVNRRNYFERLCKDDSEPASKEKS